jgi:hypothetical protein
MTIGTVSTIGTIGTISPIDTIDTIHTVHTICAGRAFATDGEEQHEGHHQDSDQVYFFTHFLPPC